MRPFKSSLVSSGIFVLVSKYHLFFWIGAEYYSCYLDENTFDSQAQLISEELLAKLVFVYEQATSFAHIHDEEEPSLIKDKSDLISSKKITFCVEGQENEIWDEYIQGRQAKAVMAANKRKTHRGAVNTVVKSYATLRQ